MTNNKIKLNPTTEDLISIAQAMGNKTNVLVYKNNKEIKLSIKRAMLIKDIDALYIPSQMEQLEEVMGVLREPEKGCPWDLEQDHESLLKHLIEESHEFCDAVVSKDTTLMLEELGDVLLQVVFHCQIAKESNKFDLNKCAKGIKDKLVFRHPHIFGESSAVSSKEVEAIWKSQKTKEKGKSTPLSGLPPFLRIEKSLDKLKNEYISGKMDKNTYRSIVQLVEREEILRNRIGELLLNIAIYGKIIGVDITLELQKAINSWENTHKFK